MVIPGYAGSPLASRRTHGLDRRRDADYRPDVIVHLGDHWDMETCHRGQARWNARGKRYVADR